MKTEFVSLSESLNCSFKSARYCYAGKDSWSHCDKPGNVAQDSTVVIKTNRELEITRENTKIKEKNCVVVNV